MLRIESEHDDMAKILYHCIIFVLQYQVLKLWAFSICEWHILGQGHANLQFHNKICMDSISVKSKKFTCFMFMTQLRNVQLMPLKLCHVFLLSSFSFLISVFLLSSYIPFNWESIFWYSYTNYHWCNNPINEDHVIYFVEYVDHINLQHDIHSVTWMITFSFQSKS